MQIEHIQIQGFGALSGDVSFHDDLNLIIGPNEAGKSTLATAIMSLLYGVREARGQRWMSTDDDARYRPLQGGPFAVAGIVKTAAGQRLNIWRDLEKDTFRVVDLGSGKDISDTYARSPSGDELGQKLLGLTRTQFEKLAFIRQEGAAANTDYAEFSDTIARLLSTEDPGAGTVQQALGALEDARAKYPGVTGKGPIKLETEQSRLVDHIELVEGELHELEQQRLASEAAMEEIAALQLQNASLTEEVRKNEYLAALARETEIEQSIAARQEAMSAVREIQIEIRALAPYAERDLDHIEELTGLTARILDRRQTLEGLDTEISALDERKNSLSSSIESLGEKAEVSPDALQEMNLDIERIASAATRIDSVHIDERAAEKTLEELNVTPASAEKMQQCLMALDPADRSFMLTYSEAVSGLDAKRATFSQDLDAIQHSITEIDSERSYAIKSARTHVMIGIGALVAVILFALGLLFTTEVHYIVFLLPAVVCMAFTVYGIIRIPAAQKIHETERDYASNKLVSRQAVLAELDLEIQQMKSRFKTLAADFDSAYDEMLERLRQYNQAQSVILTWRATVDRRLELERQRNECADRLRELFSFCELLQDNEELTVDVARRCARELQKSTGYHAELDQVRKDRQRLEEQRLLIHSEWETFRKRVMQILHAGGVPEETPLNEGISLYSDAARKKSRLEHLQTEQLPSTQRAAGSEGLIAALEAELMHVRKRRIELKARYPLFSELQAVESTAIYDERRAKAQQQLGKDAETLAEREKLLAVEMSGFREKAPSLHDDLHRLLSAQRQADRFQKATTYAMEMMEQIAGEVHSRWSPILAEELNHDLEQYDIDWTLSLSRDLTLTVHPRKGGPALDAEGIARHLSRGTREQIYLALRLLLARQVGREEHLPLLLDDPFVNADDERFVVGMEDLIEQYGSANQVFVFSCHALRYGQLSKLHTTLKDAVVELPHDPHSTEGV